MYRIFIVIAIFFSFSACSASKTIEVEIPLENNAIIEQKIKTDEILESKHPDNILQKNEEKLEPEIIEESNEQKTIKLSIPAQVHLDVTFVPQAPYANWDPPYKEACEEASLIIAKYYVENKLLDKDIMTQEINSMVNWEMDTFGYYEHTNIDEIIQIARDYYQLQVKKINMPSKDILQKELSDGNIILAPMAGRELGNPFYKAPGPVYHLLVLIGYNKKNFITHDVGTKRGENYEYSYDTIMNAMHDWNDIDILKGEKSVISVIKESK